MKKVLILVRGIPGSGKSSLAGLLTKAICCADDYVTYNGVYMWKPETIGASHAWCQRKCRRYMQIGASRIAVANTTTTEKEMQPYLDMAQEFGYIVFSVIVENRHSGVNTHNVPEATLEKMRERFSIKL